MQFQGKSGNEIMEMLLDANTVDEFRAGARVLASRKSVSRTDLLTPVFERLINLVERQSEESQKNLVDCVVELLSDKWGLDEQIDGDPYWPSSIVLSSDGSNNSMGEVFEHRFSALKLCGYSVGKSSNLTDDDRRDLLTNFLENRLHPTILGIFGDEYGEPKSLKRLLKMANVIASNCKNFKRRSDAEAYQFAIADYDRDLAFLKGYFFDPWLKGNPSLPWPDTKV